MPDPVEWTTERWPVNKLKDWPHNPRRITEKGLDDLKASMTRLGYIDPIAVNADGTIIGGHARKRVLKDLKIKDVEVRVPSRLLTEKEVEEAVIRLNKNIAGEWDFDKLANHFDVGELMDWGFAPEDFGIINTPAEGLTDPDDVPEEPPAPISRPGDVWVLGNHRIMCGDSTSADDVGKLLGDVKPLLMVTDPPYGVEYDPAKARQATKGSARGKVLNDDRADWSEAWALFPGDVAYVWHAMRYAGTVFASLEACGFEIRAEIVWAKSQLVLSRGHYHPQHESCWYATRSTAHWAGDRKQTTLWQIDKPQKSETGHGTQKPVECMKRPIENNSSPGQAVYEPFSGSGTTIIAAEMTGRSCYAMELNPAYVDMAVMRWQNFTGGKALHAETGERFVGIPLPPEGEAAA